MEKTWKTSDPRDYVHNIVTNMLLFRVDKENINVIYISQIEEKICTLEQTFFQPSVENPLEDN